MDGVAGEEARRIDIRRRNAPSRQVVAFAMKPGATGEGRQAARRARPVRGRKQARLSASPRNAPMVAVMSELDVQASWVAIRCNAFHVSVKVHSRHDEAGSMFMPMAIEAAIIVHFHWRLTLIQIIIT